MMKPLLLFILSLLAIYTYAKKILAAYMKDLSKSTQVWMILISIIVGFYDGFIGPGTGSF
jgi:uncharacterized membrane protein YfcA